MASAGKRAPLAVAPQPVSAPEAREAPVSGEVGNRKLIRRSLADVRRDQGLGARATSSRKSAPPEQTNAEAYYYLKQMQSKTIMVVRLVDGEELRGWIEWYDRDVIKLNRENAPNLVLPKHSIKYLYKEEEERMHRRRKVRVERPGGGDGPPV